jgi:transposase
MQIRSVGIDLGKTTFHLVALGDSGKVLLRKKFSQKQLIAFTANMQTCLIGMEACSGSHFLGRALREQGHDVKLIPAQFVKPFVKSNKNDFIDARAVVLRSKRDRIAMGAWMTSLETRAPRNVLIVATAHKLARIAWAVLSTGQDYRAVPEALTV